MGNKKNHNPSFGFWIFGARFCSFSPEACCNRDMGCTREQGMKGRRDHRSTSTIGPNATRHTFLCFHGQQQATIPREPLLLDVNFNNVDMGRTKLTGVLSGDINCCARTQIISFQSTAQQDERQQDERRLCRDRQRARS